MKTKYVVTTTNPDFLDPENFEDQLEHCEPFTTERAARAAQKDFARRTNMDVYLLKVELVGKLEGEF